MKPDAIAGRPNGLSGKRCSVFGTITIAAVVLASCQQTKKESPATAPRFTLTKLDGGPLTRFDPSAPGRTKQVPDTSLHRSFVILNDSNFPLQITSFGFRAEEPDRMITELTNARLAYVFDWSLRPRISITAWEVHDVRFDLLNRFLDDHINDNAVRTGDTKQLTAGEEYKTNRMNWSKSEETDQLGRWLTSILFVSAIRTADGKVWSCDKSALTAQISQLGFQLPAEFQW